MLDQSYSYENFRIILDVENRKGKYLEDSSFFNDSDLFEKSRSISDKIIEVNKSISDEYEKLQPKHLRKTDDYLEIEKLETTKLKLKEEREIALEEILREISAKVNSDDYKLLINKGLIKFGDQLYISEDIPENYFVQKQLQRNIHKTFDVKQADRKMIISQLKLLLSDNFPKVIIRTDISKFYESIPHKHLIDRIEENSLLSYPSKKIIKEILNQYWKILLNDGIKNINDERIGLPRGIGVSAFLSELYLKDFDKILKSLPNVIFYARYVDDIIIIITPNHRNEKLTSSQLKAEVKKIANRFNLKINEDKTQIIDLRKSNSQRKSSKMYPLTFLGYEFKISYRKSTNIKNKIQIEQLPLCVGMSSKKKQKLTDKIKTAFNQFDTDILKYAGAVSKSNNILVQRIKILTHNFRLYRRKDNILIGIYFSNEFLTDDLQDLIDLDDTLKSEIKRVSLKLSPIAENKLNGLSFKDGFVEKSTLNFNFNNISKRGVVNIEKIIKIWANL
jgi:hypothetical protein